MYVLIKVRSERLALYPLFCLLSIKITLDAHSQPWIPGFRSGTLAAAAGGLAVRMGNGGHLSSAALYFLESCRFHSVTVESSLGMVGSSCWSGDQG